jgi:hypothetical protein
MIPRLMYIASRLITIYMVMEDKIGHIEKLISSRIATLHKSETTGIEGSERVNLSKHESKSS